MMKAIHYKASILMAGFLNGLNISPSFANITKLSKTLESLEMPCITIDGNGQTVDGDRLSNDWNKVRADLMTAYKDATKEP